MTFAQALETLPQEANWSSSFGYPGCDGYSEIHRDAKGNRWEIARSDCNDAAGWIIQKI